MKKFLTALSSLLIIFGVKSQGLIPIKKETTLQVKQTASMDTVIRPIFKSPASLDSMKFSTFKKTTPVIKGKDGIIIPPQVKIALPMKQTPIKETPVKQAIIKK
jgi:hypothetical protein